jgi:biopolymer transport protein ExbB
LADTVGDAVIGAGFAGDLDEVALANVARSSDYVRALSASQGAESLMLALAEEEGEESTSYMAILLGAVTIDGWVVIGILMVMFVISVWVMIAKSVSLRAVQKANLRFLGFFRAQTAALLDPANPQVASLATDRGLEASSNYQLYKACLVEVKARLDTLERRGKPRVLSAAMLDAVRASLDATIVRSNQRFNSGIVLLTIAISGGPFLGLLGTVVGVMITFAAIAASGDVNVNSIAPGIAAALVATVAGLAVAIPALFGYNWLAIQIKNVASDTQVFADELLTLTAEQWTD